MRLPIKPITLQLLESVYGKLTFAKPKPPPTRPPSTPPTIVWHTSERTMPYDVWCETYGK